MVYQHNAFNSMYHWKLYSIYWKIIKMITWLCFLFAGSGTGKIVVNCSITKAVDYVSEHSTIHLGTIWTIAFAIFECTFNFKILLPINCPYHDLSCALLDWFQFSLVLILVIIIHWDLMMSKKWYCCSFCHNCAYTVRVTTSFWSRHDHITSPVVRLYKWGQTVSLTVIWKLLGFL